MNTIDHRKNCKELIDNLDKSMERLNKYLIILGMMETHTIHF